MRGMSNKRGTGTDEYLKKIIGILREIKESVKKREADISLCINPKAIAAMQSIQDAAALESVSCEQQ